MTTTENPITTAYRAELMAKSCHRYAFKRLQASNPTEQDYENYRAASKALDAARAHSAKLDAELNQMASF